MIFFLVLTQVFGISTLQELSQLETAFKDEIRMKRFILNMKGKPNENGSSSEDTTTSRMTETTTSTGMTGQLNVNEELMEQLQNVLRFVKKIIRILKRIIGFPYIRKKPDS